MIKECLVEILTEGVETYAVSEGKRQQRNVVERAERRFDPRLDTPIGGNKPQRSSHMDNVVSAAAGGDPVLKSILSDTAKTTYAQQMESGDTVHGEQRAESQHRVQFNGAPQQAFGDSASRWAALAFMNDKVT